MVRSAFLGHGQGNNIGENNDHHEGVDVFVGNEFEEQLFYFVFRHVVGGQIWLVYFDESLDFYPVDLFLSEVLVLALLLRNGVVYADNCYKQIHGHHTAHHDKHHEEHAEQRVVVSKGADLGAVDEPVHVIWPAFESRNHEQGYHGTPNLVEV